jgi:serine phosphatase RsbU (regulator of sigma subunit)
MSSVAGDFYDFVQIDDKHLGILIADVSGHGLPSALIASMLQVALTAQVAHSSEPAKVLSGLNRALCGKFTDNFVTAAYVYVDLERSLIRYAGAGHPPVMHFRPSTGKTSKVLENGLILGLFDEVTYEALERPLEPGDRYVLYTDGVLEAANPAAEFYGADRFMRFMENNHTLRAEQFANAFLSEIAKWSGRPDGLGQQDDITLVLFDFKRS